MFLFSKLPSGILQGKSPQFSCIFFGKVKSPKCVENVALLHFSSLSGVLHLNERTWKHQSSFELISNDFSFFSILFLSPPGCENCFPSWFSTAEILPGRLGESALGSHALLSEKNTIIALHKVLILLFSWSYHLRNLYMLFVTSGRMRWIQIHYYQWRTPLRFSFFL